MVSLKDIQARFMVEAIDCIPVIQKQAYIEAMEKVPYIVFNETDPSYYLRFEQFDAWKATQRLVSYWNWKKKIFGKRMVRSIFDLSGDGALDNDDIDLIRTGYAVILSKDIHGNSIFLFDRSRTSIDWELIDHFQCIRVLFYMCALMADEQKESGSGKLIVLNVLRSPPKFYHNYKNLSDVMSEIMPIRPKVHTLFLIKVSFASYFMQLVVPAVERNVCRFTPMSVSLCFSENDALEKLAYLGLPSSSFPASLGGTWKYESFFSWLDSQASTRSSLDTNPWWNEDDLDCQRLTPLPLELMLYEDVDYNGHDPSNMEIEPKSHYAITYTNNTSLRLSGDVPSNDLNGALKCYHSLAGVSKECIYNPCLTDQDLLPHNVRQEQTIVSERITSVNSHECAIVKLGSSLFGQQSYCRMDQTEYGALSTDDIVTLDTGFLMILPGDRSGTAVVQLEVSKAKAYSCESQKRCCFYIFSVLSQRSMGQPIDIIVLALMNDMEQNQFRYEMTFVDILQVFQINLLYVHVFYQEFGLGWFAYQRDAQTMLEKLLQISDDLTTIHILNETETFDIDDFCVVYNFDKKSLPRILGGTSTLKSLRELQKSNVMVENSIPKTVNSLVMAKSGISFCNDATSTEAQGVLFDNRYHRNPEQTSSKYPYLIDAVSSLIPDEDKDVFFSNLLHDDLLDDSSFMSVHSGIFDPY